MDKPLARLAIVVATSLAALPVARQRPFSRAARAARNRLVPVGGVGGVPRRGSETSAHGGGGPAVWTIGHSNHALDHFLALLTAHAIEVVVDVRSRPYSRHTPHFSRDPLREDVTNAGMRYLFMGRELGGRPANPSLYDEEGHVRYDAVSRTPDFTEGIARLRQGIGRHRVALLCSEDDPIHCHRRLLVGRVLRDDGVSLLHIRSDGQVESEDAVDARERPAGGRLGMFDGAEVRPWRSIRSGSRGDQPPPSSEP